jgi:hypothetical protein
MAGMKDDGAKVPVHQGLNKYFPRALKAVAAISHYGFAKYKAWGGWVTVENGEDRYENAVARHTLDRAIDGPIDPESKHPHRAHRAWNALATLELELLAAEKAAEGAQGGLLMARAPWKVMAPLAHEGPKSQLEAGGRYDNTGGEDQTQGKRGPKTVR